MVDEIKHGRFVILANLNIQGYNPHSPFRPIDFNSAIHNPPTPSSGWRRPVSRLSSAYNVLCCAGCWILVYAHIKEPFIKSQYRDWCCGVLSVCPGWSPARRFIIFSLMNVIVKSIPLLCNIPWTLFVVIRASASNPEIIDHKPVSGGWQGYW